MTNIDPEPIILAVIGALGFASTGYFSYKSAKRTKTSNGHTIGQLADIAAADAAKSLEYQAAMAERMARVEERLGRVELLNNLQLRDQLHREVD